MTTIVPTVGRKVWFRPAFSLEEEQPLDATICYVIPGSGQGGEDFLINIAYHDANGNPASAQRIPLFQGAEHEKPWGDNFCEWMPYQVGQAKKEEIPVGQQALANAVATDKVAALLKK